MVAARMIDEAGLKALDEEIVAEVDDAVTFAEASPDPAPDALWTDVLAGGQ
jgi:TPP-dependent pyruvate/acetoin dehydrogenase alpha subunit